MSERDQRRHLTAEAGTPADPDAVAEDRGPEAVDVAASDEAAPDDMVQAVADFVDDLVDDGAGDPAGDPGG